MSAFIRQMSAENMIIPEEKIKLLSIVGQGIELRYYTLYTSLSVNKCCIYIPYTLTFSGEFGCVYRGILSNWKEHEYNAVAVKTLKGIIAMAICEQLFVCIVIYSVLCEEYMCVCVYY